MSFKSLTLLHRRIPLGKFLADISLILTNLFLFFFHFVELAVSGNLPHARGHEENKGSHTPWYSESWHIYIYIWGLPTSLAERRSRFDGREKIKPGVIFLGFAN